MVVSNLARLFNYHILVYVTLWSPIWSCVLWLVNLNHRLYYIISEFGLLYLVFVTSYHPLKVSGVTYWFHYYALFLMIYIVLFGFKYHFSRFNKVLALSLLALFIAGDLWEIPVFIYDLAFNHGWNADVIWWTSHIRRLYTFASFLLLVRLGKLRFTRQNIMVLCIATIFTFILLLPSINIPEKTTFVKLVYLTCFGFATFNGLHIDE